ncbi:MAG: hypothetical protein ACRDLZ_00410 [Gaiellaceae bacterium]
MSSHDDLTDCFERKVGAWFAGEGRRTVADRKHLRQMNMALALAASRWLEMVEEGEPVERMHAWLGQIEERAERRRAAARIEAIQRARTWFNDCVSLNGHVKNGH